MALTFNPDDTIENLYKNVHAVGVQAYIEKADDILVQYGAAILPDEKYKIRCRMSALLSQIDWELSFVPEEKAKKTLCCNS